MDTLTHPSVWFNALVSDPSSAHLAIVVLAGVAAFLSVVATVLLVSGFVSPVKKRVDTVKAETADTEVLRQPHGTSTFVANLGRLLLPSRSHDKRRSNVARVLRHAGYTSDSALSIFFGARLLCIVSGPVLLFAISFFTAAYPISEAFLYSVAAAALGYIAPDVWLGRKARRRQELIRRGMPDALDLMVVCAEAGLGLTATIQRVAGEIDIQHPELADELQLMMMQTRAGIDLRTALRDLDDRTNVEDLRAFITTLLQSMRFGTSIAESLRIYADEMRDKRLQRAQELAAKLSIKMLAPIALFIMPSFLLVAMGPAILNLMKVLKTF